MRARTAMVLVTALMFVMVHAAAAGMPECVDYSAYMHRVSQLDMSWEPHAPFRVIVDGDYLYFNDINTQAGIIDISDPRNPRLLPGVMGVNFPAQDFGYQGGHVYLGDADGLTVFDVTNPHAPRREAVLALSSEAVNVIIRGARAYVSRHSDVYGEGPLDVVDISDPAAPRLVTTVDGLGGWDACISGDRLYTTSWNKFKTIDISEPDAPILVGSWDPASIGYMPWDFKVVDGMGYFACYPGDLVIANLANAAAPTVVGVWSSGPVECRAVNVSGSLALVGGDHGQLFTIDIANPAAPVALGEPLMVGNIEDIAISDGRAYIGSHWDRLSVVDIGPARAYSDIGWCNATEAVVDVCGTADPGVCLMIVGDELQVLDHAIPEAAAVVATLPLPGAPLRVVATGTRALVACAEGGLVAFDITDPRAPVALGAVAGVAEAVDLEARDGYVFATGFGGPLWVVDARAAGLPLLVSSTPTAIPAYSLAVDGNTVYLGADEQMQSLDVTDPTAPANRWVAEGPFGSELIAKDGLIYSSHPGSFRILADTGTGYEELNLVLIGTQDLCLDGATAYGVDNAGADIFDLSDPVHPAMAGSIQYTGADYCYGQCAAVSGDHVIIGYDNGRIAVAPRRCGAAVPVEVASFTASRDGDGVRLRWIVPGASESAQFRVVVRSAAGDRVMPGAWVGDGVFEARDDQAARAVGAVTYVLERRDDGGAWQAVSTTTYAPAAVVPASRLTGCTPNPFNPNTRVTFTLAAAGHVVVAVHDAAGRQVAVLADASFGAGPQALTWDGRDDRGREMASGIYLVSLRAAAGVDTRKIVLVR